MYKNPYSGKFIVLEGLDKSGKSTQAELLEKYFQEIGRPAVLTMEPTKGEHQNKIGWLIREILTGKIKINRPDSFQLLYAADRGLHLEDIIIPAVKEGKIAASDRYFFSSFAYGSIDGLDLEWLMKINDRFLLPDATIFIDTPPEICMERLKKGGYQQEFFEKEEKLRKARETFLKLSGMFENFYILDGNREISEVFQDIKEILQKVL